MANKKTAPLNAWIGVADDGTIVSHKDFKVASQWAKEFKEEHDSVTVYVFEIVSAYYADFPEEPEPELIKMGKDEIMIL